MNITSYGKNLTVTPAIEAYLAEKLTALERLSTEIAEAHVTIEMNRHHRRGDIFTVHVLLRLPESTIVVEETTSDLYACVDLVEDRIRRQLTRHVGKRRARFRKLEASWSPKNVFLEGGRRLRSFGRKQQRQLRIMMKKIWRK